MSFIQSVIKNTRELVKLRKASGQAIVNRQVLAKDVSAGTVIPATSGTVRSEIEGISNQDISVGDALTQVEAIIVSPDDTWIVDTTNNSNVAHNYQRMVLTNSLVVNNTGTDSASGVVEQVDVYGAAADKKIIVRFL